MKHQCKILDPSFSPFHPAAAGTHITRRKVQFQNYKSSRQTQKGAENPCSFHVYEACQLNLIIAITVTLHVASTTPPSQFNLSSMLWLPIRAFSRSFKRKRVNKVRTHGGPRVGLCVCCDDTSFKTCLLHRSEKLMNNPPPRVSWTQGKIFIITAQEAEKFYAEPKQWWNRQSLKRVMFCPHYCKILNLRYFYLHGLCRRISSFLTNVRKNS